MTRVRPLWDTCNRLLLLVLLLSGCAAPPPVTEVPLVAVDPGALPHFVDHLFFDGLEHSIDQSLAYLDRVPDDHLHLRGVHL